MFLNFSKVHAVSNMNHKLSKFLSTFLKEKKKLLLLSENLHKIVVFVRMLVFYVNFKHKLSQKGKSFTKDFYERTCANY